MSTVCVICEYDPLHNGHVRHLSLTRRALAPDALVCLMSGPVMQRGTLAMFDKYTRAEWAVRAGADLVVQLPTAVSCSSAQRFARGAVALAQACGADILSFGAETADSDALGALADILVDEPPALSAAIRDRLSAGASFASARADAVGSLYGATAQTLLSSPNNILAVEYCAAIRRLGADITPFPVERQRPARGETVAPDGTVSASFLRGAIAKQEQIAQFVPSFVQTDGATDAEAAQEAVYRLFRAKALAEGRAALEPFCEREDGLAARIANAAATCGTAAAFFRAATTSRYPLARIRRIVLAFLLGILPTDAETEPTVRKILAYDAAKKTLLPRGKGVLLSAKDFADADEASAKAFAADCTADRLRAVACGRAFDENRCHFTAAVDKRNG